MYLIDRILERRKIRKRLQAIRRELDSKKYCDICARRLFGPGVHAVEISDSGVSDIVVCMACRKDPLASIITAAAERQFAPRHPEGAAHPSGSFLSDDGPSACPEGTLPPAGTF